MPWAEQAIGQPFPEPLAESLLRHNGMDHYDLLPPFWSLLDVRSIVNAWQTRLVIDQRSYRRRGRIGKADHETGRSFSRHAMWASLPALLDATATALESGEAVDGYLPVAVDEDELDWDFRCLRRLRRLAISDVVST
ncbi:hypothetical protein [Streptomyces canus]|uniref:hypothetical protein n=1 Tax=Streptomyces canus TaxID=58343 RepID=UPI00380F379C